MYDPGVGDLAIQYDIYGDEQGHFIIQIVSIGIGIH